MENARQISETHLGDRVTIIVPTPTQAAIEIHRQNMWDKGYRLESRIDSQTYFESDGHHINTLFEGKEMFAATFVKRQ